MSYQTSYSVGDPVPSGCNPYENYLPTPGVEKWYLQCASPEQTVSQLNGVQMQPTKIPLRYSYNQALPSYMKFSSSQYISFVSVLPHYLFITSALAFTLLLIYLSSRFLLLKQQLKTPHIQLLIKPTNITLQTAHSTEQLFTHLYALISQKTFFEQLLHKKKTFTLELVATRYEGIRFILHTPIDKAELIKKAFLSYLPEVEITTVSDYLPTNITACFKYAAQGVIPCLIPFKFVRNFPYPLQNQKLLNQHDPIAYLTGNMTKLSEQELIALQFVLNPVDGYSNRRIALKAKEILYHYWHGRDISKYLDERGLSKYPLFFLQLFGTLLYFVIYIALGILDVIFTIIFPTGSSNAKPKEKKPFIPTPAQQLLFTQVQEKLSQPLFETSMRLLIVSDKHKEAVTRANGLTASFATFDNQTYQALRIQRQFIYSFIPWKIKKYLVTLSLFQFANRLLSFSNTIVLSATELASVYHLPYTNTTKTEDLVKSKSAKLPTPLSRKKLEKQLDVVIGENTYGGVITPIGLTSNERSQHTYIIGKTGMGKSTIMQGMAYQDIIKGKGVCVIDPHGDMVENLLSSIPKTRMKDVIYFNPSDKDFPIGLNILKPQTQFSDLDVEHDRIAQSIIAIFMKITPEKHWGQRMEHILRNAVLTTLQIPENTHDTPYISLYTIQKLLTDETYRKRITGALSDPILKEFWEKQFNKFKKQQQADMVSPIVNKIGEFITNKLSRNILLQEKSTISFSDMLNQEKILLVNLSKGKIGEERSNFFGTVITSLIQLAVYERAYIPENKRKDFFVYIDEFQNFASTHFTTLFSEARKYHVYFTPTHQNIEQIQDENVSKIITGNSGTIITLKCGPSDEKFLLPFFEPEVHKGHIVNLPPHHFFMKVTNGESEDAFSGVTKLSVINGSETMKASLIAHSRSTFATPQNIVCEQLNKLFTQPVAVKKKVTTSKKPAVKSTPEKNTKRVQRVKKNSPPEVRENMPF